eukprot:scaffold633_cov288-Ochromonas_danica.AAC.19
MAVITAPGFKEIHNLSMESSPALPWNGLAGERYRKVKKRVTVTVTVTVDSQSDSDIVRVTE